MIFYLCAGGFDKAAGKDGEDQTPPDTAAVVEGAELAQERHGVAGGEIRGQEALPYQHRQLVIEAGKSGHGQQEAIKGFSVIGVRRLRGREYSAA